MALGMTAEQSCIHELVESTRDRSLARIIAGIHSSHPGGTRDVHLGYLRN